MAQKDLDMLKPKKKVVSITISTFENKNTGEIVDERMGETYEDGTSLHKVFDGRYWKFIKSREVKCR